MIDVAFLGTAVRPAGTAVVIDVLRATSTITLAMASGYERVLVAGSIDEARELRGPGRILAGEAGCARAPGFDLGNSPEETLEPRAPELVLATTNGAPAVVASAAVADEVLAASLLNLDAVLARLARVEDVLLVCAGTDGRVSIEDVYLASYPTAQDALEASAGAIGLRREGLESDIAFCAQESIVGVVPRLATMLGAIAVLTVAQEPAQAAATTAESYK
jgi:2-phosphosulfolactate phosphatase